MIGWARRGRVRELVDLSFPGLSLLGLAAFLVLIARAPETPAAAGPVLIGAGYLAALIVLWLNRTHPWILVVLLGTALNTAVILANGGRMPVSEAALSRIAHPLILALHPGAHSLYVPAAPGTPLSSLGDFLAVEIGGVGAVLSPGDLVMAGGVAGFVQAVMTRQKKRALEANRRT